MLCTAFVWNKLYRIVYKERTNCKKIAHTAETQVIYCPHMPIGKVWILFVFVCLYSNRFLRRV